MGINYTAIATGALQALRDAGQAMSLTVPGAAVYDATTGSATATPADHACTGVLLPPAAMKGSGFTFAADVIERAQALAYIAASGLATTPAPACRLTVGTDLWAVIGADTLSPAGVPVLHAVALVRG